MDFLHVTASLPYFDFFFTEKELRSIINKHKLNEKYKCLVLSNINDVLETLEKNVTNTTPSPMARI